MNSLINAGSENKIARLVQYLAEKSWSVDVVYLNPPHDLEERFQGGVRLTFLDRKRRIDLSAIADLKELLKSRAPDVVVSVNVFPTVYMYLAGAYSSQKRFSTIALINKTEYLPGLGDRLRAQLYAWLLRRSDRIIFGAQSQKRLWVQRYHLEEAKASVIYNGVDVRYFSTDAEIEEPNSVRQRLGFCDSDFVLVAVAGLRPVKQLQLLLGAMAKLESGCRGLRAIIVGDGPERAHLERLADDLSLRQDVRFIGNVDDVRPYLAAGDLFVLTSSSETFSNAALEAMSMSRAVILPKVGGCGEMIFDNLNGWLFEPGNTEQLVELIREAVSAPSNVNEKGEAAREVVLRTFQVEDMYEKYESIFLNATQRIV